MKTRLEKQDPGEKKPDFPPRGAICAIATPIGEGGIGIIRISGDQAVMIAARVLQNRNGRRVEDCASHVLVYGTVRDPSTGERLDEVMFSVMRAPRTYTRADTVEVYCHGGHVLLHRILALLVRQGARLAEPGEFTKWAFLNGRIDLTQAEGVMDLIHAKSEAGQRAATAQMGGDLYRRVERLRNEALQLLAEIEAGIDFTEEDIHFLSQEQIQGQLTEIKSGIEALLKTAENGQAVRDGIATAIIGRPNVGKSSLLNTLLRQNRAIVTPVPGTTRDVLEEWLNLGGIPIRIMDTAGLRETDDPVEREGVSRSHLAIQRADFVILVLDATQSIGAEQIRLFEATAGKKRVIVFNKTDLLPNKTPVNDQNTAAKNNISRFVYISALTGQGIEALKEIILEEIRSGMVICGDREAMINLRHQELLLQAKEAIQGSFSTVNENRSPELLALDMRTAIDRLGEITGATTTDDLLNKIFKQFCIGK